MTITDEIVFERNFKLETVAKTHYEPKLPYHNFEHILNTLAFGNKILKDCYRENVVLNKNIVYLAILFHDAGYSKDHTCLGFETKEKYSADLAEYVLLREKYSPTEIESVKEAILSTEKNATCKTAEQQAVRAADLYGMAASYDIFLSNSLRLKKEHELLSETRISWDTWRTTSINIVKDFIKLEIPLTGFFKKNTGSSPFETAVRKNLVRFSAEAIEPK